MFTPRVVHACLAGYIRVRSGTLASSPTPYPALRPALHPPEPVILSLKRVMQGYSGAHALGAIVTGCASSYVQASLQAYKILCLYTSFFSVRLQRCHRIGVACF